METIITISLILTHTFVCAGIGYIIGHSHGKEEAYWEKGGAE